MTVSRATPSISASGVSTRRCASTGTASALMSSGSTKARPFDQRARARRLHERERRARRGAEVHARVLARVLGQAHHVLEDLVLDVHAVHQLLHGEDLARLEHAPRRGRRVHVAQQDVQLVLGVRVADQQPHQEAIDLRLGQRVGARLLDRVLRGEHDERLGQRARLAVDRDLRLLHRLEQRALRLGRRAVDLVAEHDVGEDRPLAQLELARARRQHVGARDVGRQQVGRELDAPKVRSRAWRRTP